MVEWYVAALLGFLSAFFGAFAGALAIILLATWYEGKER